jgi:crossover junction endodeoxyribonuclease RuvC
VIVLGCDQALGATGWAVIDTDGVPGRERVLEHGVVKTQPGVPDQERQQEIAATLLEIARRVKPDLIGLEGTQVQKNASTAIRLSELRGALLSSLKPLGCPLVTVPTATRRKQLGIANVRGYGAVKQRACDAVLLRYGLALTDDEADAIGIALGAVVVQRRDARKGLQETLGIKPGRKQRRRTA